MNRTQRKMVKKAKAEQLAAVMEMRALVHEVARELYVRRIAQGDPAETATAHDCVRAGIVFVDALNSFAPTPASVQDSGPRPVEPGSTEEMEAKG